MNTYKQSIKEKSRIEIWTRAIKRLTTDRQKQQVLNPVYIRRLWDYSFDEVLKNATPNENYIDSWTDFANNSYEEKQPKSLKVAYFCGPEPENDLNIMVSQGILIENVWAVESDKSMYRAALQAAQKSYPTLKIFNGVISDLIKIISFKFDIIYLDFTAPLFSLNNKPLLTINSVFENNALNDLGILVVNSCLPEKNQDNIEFLASYFRSHPFLESCIYTGNNEDADFHEGADVNGYISRADIDEETEEFEDKIFEDLIESNFKFAYSAFSTHYPAMVAGYMQPMFKVASSTASKRMLLKTDNNKINETIKKISTITDYDVNIDEELDGFDFSGGELYEQHEDLPIWNFISRLKGSSSLLCQRWHEQFSTKISGLSYLESIQLYDLLRLAHYSYKDILSETVSNTIDKIINSLPDSHGGRFCDVPLPHLWMELAINHLGNAHHINTNSHWRATYKAKTQEMYIDMFSFDNCRALYEWLPLFNLYGDDTATIERQIIIRACMDAIKKQNHHVLFHSYYGAHMIPIHEKTWSNLGELKPRENLNL